MMQLSPRNFWETGVAIARSAAGRVQGVRRSGGIVLPSYCDGKRWWRNGYVTDGPMSDLVTALAAGQIGLGCSAIIDEPAVSGLTRPPASGTKLSRMEWWQTRLSDNSTLAFKPRGRQPLFVRPGNNSNPVLADFTLAGATNQLVGELFQTPAGLLATEGLVIDFDVLCGRTTPATGTPVVALVVGSTAVAIATYAANVNSMARLTGKIFVRTATSQVTTYSVGPLQAGNVAGTGNGVISLALGTALTWSVQIVSAGTSGDKHNVLDVDIGVSG